MPLTLEDILNAANESLRNNNTLAAEDYLMKLTSTLPNWNRNQNSRVYKTVMRLANKTGLNAYYFKNNNNNNSPPRTGTPITGVAKKVALKWRMGPARNVILPKNNNSIAAPVNLSFNRGNYAIRYTKKWVRNGTNKVIRQYYKVPTFERLTNKKWPVIFRMKNSDIVLAHSPHLKADKTRVYRRNLTLVRFV